MKYHRGESFMHFTYFEAISLVSTRKNRGMVYLPPEKAKIETCLSFFLSIGIDPLNWQSFIEIGGMACPVLYWKTLEHVSKLLRQTQFKIFITIYREININC